MGRHRKARDKLMTFNPGKTRETKHKDLSSFYCSSEGKPVVFNLKKFLCSSRKTGKKGNFESVHNEECPWGLGQMLRVAGRWMGVSGRCRRQQAPR
jgi:hypothetical protein